MIHGHKRTAVLVALLRWEATESMPPSVRDIAAASGVALVTCHAHLKRLRKMGLVTWAEGREKTLRSNVAVVVR